MAARTRSLSLAVLLLAGACHGSTPVSAPPLDRFYFPTSIALRHVDASGATCIPDPTTGRTPGCTTQLLVASSNFDLRYDPINGGTVIAVDVETALGLSPASAPPVLPQAAILGAAKVGTFTGQLAVLDEATCPGWESGVLTGTKHEPQVLVTSRSQKALYRVDLGPNGPVCSGGCQVPLDSTLADPYGVTIACGNFPPAPATIGSTGAAQQVAFVSYLRAPLGVGWLSRLDLTGVGLPALTRVNLGFDPIATSAFDPGSGLLFTTARFGIVGTANFRAYQLATPLIQGVSVNLFDAIRGAELTGIALSSDAQRAYVALRIYDADAAVSLGGRPATDLGGALAVIDLAQVLAGAPAASALLRVVPVDRGASDVQALARPGTRDLVAVASPDDGSVALYDDETGEVAQVFGAIGAIGACDPGTIFPQPCIPGDPSLGLQPFALAFESRGDTEARLFVASFDRSWIDVLTIDPTQPSKTPSVWQRIGPERP